MKHNEGDAIREEIKSDVTVVARFQDMFGSHIVIQTERGHPVWVTVFVATPDEETRYRVYTNSFTKEEWHPEALVASDFKASMQDYVPQPVENRLNKMMQDEMQARERRRRIFV